VPTKPRAGFSSQIPPLSRTIFEVAACFTNLRDMELAEFFTLWMALANMKLVPKRTDELVLRWSDNGAYSAKSTYNAFFAGTSTMLAHVVDEIWRSWGPCICNFFAWLMSKNICWTTDKLQRSGFPHPTACPLCNQG
jgi:hypothetical protein